MSTADKVVVRLRVNGEDTAIMAPPYKTLLEVLREDLGLTGTKHGCELGECSMCGVLVDGKPFLSCLAIPLDLEGRDVTTIEGLARGREPRPSREAIKDALSGVLCRCTGYLKIFEAVELAASRGSDG